MREFSVPAPFVVEETASVVHVVFDYEREDPDQTAFMRLVDEQWAPVTCAQAAAQIRAIANGLIAKGVAVGDRVALISATRYEWAIIDYAILSIGAITVPIYETSSAEQVEWVLQDSGAVALFAETDAHAAIAEQLVADLPSLREIFPITGSNADGALRELAEAGKDTDPEELGRRLAQIRASAPATLIYTSGTTGRPKGCQLTHSNLVYETRGARVVFPDYLQKGSRTLTFLPLAHVLARTIAMACFQAKVTVGFTSDIKTLVPTFAVFKPTFIVSVPRIFEKVYNTARQNAQNGGKGKIFDAAADTAVEYSRALDSGGPGIILRVKRAAFDKLVYGKLRAALGGECVASISGGAPLGGRLGHFYRGVGLTIYEGYGLTETTAACTVNVIKGLKIGSVGLPLPGNAIKIAEDGELLVSGGVVFDSYWNNPKATADSFVDGWFRTGDLGAIDEDGFLTITGRKKEIIVTAGGKNVAPAVLEDHLRASPLISQAMVVGEQQPFIGALITIDPEAFEGWKARNGKPADATVEDMTEDPDLIAEIDSAVKATNQAVSHAESIKKFRILPVDFTEATGEMTPTLKVKRNVVAEKFAADIEGIYAPAPAGA